MVLKFSTIVSLILAAGLSCNAEAASISPVCSGYKVNSQRMDLNLNGHRITLVGWTHKVPNVGILGIDLYLAPLKGAVISASKDDCASARTTLLAALKEEKIAESVTENRKVMSQLRSISQDFKIDYIGIEQSKEDIDYMISPLYDRSVLNLEKDFAIIQKKCQKETADAIERFKEAIFEPAELFNRTLRSPIPQLPMEDDELKMKGAEIYGEYLEAADEVAQAGLSDENETTAGKKINALVDQLRTYREIPDKDIQDTAAEIKNPDLASKFKKMFKIWNEFMVNMRERNEATVKKGMEAPGNLVIIIGRGHLQDLSAKFMTTCKGKDAGNAPASPNSKKRITKFAH